MTTLSFGDVLLSEYCLERVPIIVNGQELVIDFNVLGILVFDAIVGTKKEHMRTQYPKFLETLSMSK